MGLEQLHDDLWVATMPLRFLGIELGARMTVVRLPDGALLLHSPIRADAPLVREVEALGAIAHLVAPNRMHHLFIAEWKQALRAATIHAAPGLDRKRPDLEIDGMLGEEADPAWASVLDQVVMRGAPFLSEVVFFHRPSATLILTDLAFNIGSSAPGLTQAFFRLAGTHGRLAPPALEQLLVRDRAAFAAAREEVLAWPFERIIVAHGEVCERGGREQLREGYDWLLGDRRRA